MLQHIMHRYVNETKDSTARNWSKSKGLVVNKLHSSMKWGGEAHIGFGAVSVHPGFGWHPVT